MKSPCALKDDDVSDSNECFGLPSKWIASPSWTFMKKCLSLWNFNINWNSFHPDTFFCFDEDFYYG